MNKLLLALVTTTFSVGASAYTVNFLDDNPISFGNSWDGDSLLVADILGAYGDSAILQQVDMATFAGTGAVSIILEEIAGYETRTTFGYYTDIATGGDRTQLFSGSDTNGAIASFDLGVVSDFGFYIDSNGPYKDPGLMYTDNKLNSYDDYQVAIFEILGEANTYILGWEDLDLNGDDSGDRDYQDMIVRVKIQSVPEPGSMALLAIGMIGLGVARKRSAS